MFVVAVAQWTEQHDFSMKGGDAKLPTNKTARAYKILHPPQAEGSSREKLNPARFACCLRPIAGDAAAVACVLVYQLKAFGAC
jgi:hypothetical protein